MSELSSNFLEDSKEDSTEEQDIDINIENPKQVIYDDITQDDAWVVIRSFFDRYGLVSQ